MNHLKIIFLIVMFFIICLPISSFAFRDMYPKNPKIDVVNYIFKLELSDTTDEIVGETTVDVRFLSDGVQELRLDLIQFSKELNKKGMTVSGVTSGNKSLEYRHENNAVFIKLPANSKANQRTKYTISYKGIPANGLKIANNKYGERTFFSDNWADKGRNWLPTVDHPSDKAMCEFIVTAPSHYQVISNGLKIVKKLIYPRINA